MTPAADRYLLVKHSEGWNVDRCTRWMDAHGVSVDWCYPASGQPFPDPAPYAGVIVFGGAGKRQRLRRRRLGARRAPLHRALPGRRRAVLRHLPRRPDARPGARREGRPTPRAARRDRFSPGRADTRVGGLPRRAADRHAVAFRGVRAAAGHGLRGDGGRLSQPGVPARRAHARCPVPPRGERRGARDLAREEPREEARAAQRRGSCDDDGRRPPARPSRRRLVRRLPPRLDPTRRPARPERRGRSIRSPPDSAGSRRVRRRPHRSRPEHARTPSSGRLAPGAARFAGRLAISARRASQPSSRRITHAQRLRRRLDRRRADDRRARRPVEAAVRALP